MRLKNEAIELLVQAQNEERRKADRELSYLDEEGDPLGSELANGCTSSNQCASGYACVNGECQLIDDGSNSGGSSGAGSACEGDNGNCNSGGPDACQQTPTCGEEEEARECCGDRCCYYGSNASPRPGVTCQCGECPELPACNEWCAAYFLANGEPGAGCEEGQFGNSCNLCTECFAGTCLPISEGFAPCFCSGSECDSNSCETCNLNPEDVGFGDCEFDVNNTPCQTCQTVQNYECPCGFSIGFVENCVPYGENAWAGLHQKAREMCREKIETAGLDPDACCSVNVNCNSDYECPQCHFCSTSNATCQKSVGCDCYETYEYGLGTYAVQFREFIFVPEIRRCSDDSLVSPEISSNPLTTEFYPNIYGLRIEPYNEILYGETCPPIGTNDAVVRSYYRIFAKTEADADWTVIRDLTSPEGNRNDTGQYYESNTNTGSVIPSQISAATEYVQLNGEEVFSAGCEEVQYQY